MVLYIDVSICHRDVNLCRPIYTVAGADAGFGGPGGFGFGPNVKKPTSWAKEGGGGSQPLITAILAHYAKYFLLFYVCRT